MVAATRQLCTFFLGEHTFGVDAHLVQEVIRYQEMTRVPLTPPSVSGLINLRGQIVTAIDMRKRLSYPERTDGKLPMNVVIRSEEGAVSLLVDAIGDVIEVSQDCFETPPDTLQGTTRELIGGAYKLKDRLLLVLNTKNALHEKIAE
ncbi:MAG: chemotaxis protein CheW [Pirellulaceae bacterium]